MELGPGHQYRIANWDTDEWASFTLLELYSYKGAYLCYGELHHHTVHVPATHGVVPVAARPSAFPVIPTASIQEIETLTKWLGGSPLMLVEGYGPDVLAILNAGRKIGLSMSKDALLKRSRELVDLYHQPARQRVKPSWATGAVGSPVKPSNGRGSALGYPPLVLPPF